MLRASFVILKFLSKRDQKIETRDDENRSRYPANRGIGASGGEADLA